MSRRKSLVGLAAVAATGWVVRRLGQRSGATDEEVRATLAGDNIVSRPNWQSTRATTIAAPPAAVWPWIVQMGFPAHRGGWYTPYWLDRIQWGIQARSADRIRPELQDLEVGDRVPDSLDWSVFFTVKALEPEHAMALHSTRHLLRPLRTIDFSWAFVLQATGPSSTRLIIRARVRAQPLLVWRIVSPMIGLGDYLNASNMLRTIKTRAEAPA